MNLLQRQSPSASLLFVRWRQQTVHDWTATAKSKRRICDAAGGCAVRPRPPEQVPGAVQAGTSAQRGGIRALAAAEGGGGGLLRGEGQRREGNLPTQRARPCCVRDREGRDAALASHLSAGMQRARGLRYPRSSAHALLLLSFPILAVWFGLHGTLSFKPCSCPRLGSSAKEVAAGNKTATTRLLFPFTAAIPPSSAVNTTITSTVVFGIYHSTTQVTDMCSFYHLPSTVIGHAKHRTLNAAYSFYNVATTVRKCEHNNSNKSTTTNHCRILDKIPRLVSHVASV